MCKSRGLLILLKEVSQSLNLIAQSLTKAHFLTDLDDGEYCVCYDGGVEVTGLLVTQAHLYHVPSNNLI